jgi:hypothetical protein
MTTLIGSLAVGSAFGENIPRPEHPRPDFERASWLNLNGRWEFDIDKDAAIAKGDVKPDMKLTRGIVVPFCPESRLSGIGETDFMKHVMYRRQFTLPEAMKGRRILLNFGAVDWDAMVWVNGKPVGDHKGGYTPFQLDITEAVKDGQNEVFLSVYDDTATGLQATGKQSHKKESYGCVYTRTTGIWQTVWLEAAGETWLREFSLTPDLDGNRLFFQAWIAGPCKGATVRLEASANGKPVATEDIPAAWRSTLGVLSIPNPRRWEVGAPFLYDLTITILRDGKVDDQVKTYFGMRKVSIEGNRFLINDKPVFQRTILDQGFYPDGIYTAPTDEALRRDVELSMAAGFNGARLHQKVFEPRLLYWADKLGYLVWGEYPSWGVNWSRSEAVTQVVLEWQECLRRDRNHPAVIGWCPLNETGGSEEIWRAEHLLSVTQMVDPTRPFLDSSGYHHLYKDTDVFDSHNYNQDPDAFKGQFSLFALTGDKPFQNHRGKENEYAGQPYFVSEYGGTKLKRGDEPEDKKTAWGYGNSAEDVDAFVKRYKGLTDVLLDNPNCFGFCYTQLTDVEQEQNGVYYYDRKQKYDPARLKAINVRPAAYETQGPRLGKLETKEILATSKNVAQTWRYTTEKPALRQAQGGPEPGRRAGDNWFAAGFNDSGWKEGPGGFGREKTPGAVIRTPWLTDHIWIRREFEVKEAPGDSLFLEIHHDDDAEVYVNGTLIATFAKFTQSYVLADVTEKLRPVLKRGKNLIAVHCHQTVGGQYIDVGIQSAKVVGG